MLFLLKNELLVPFKNLGRFHIQFKKSKESVNLGGKHIKHESINLDISETSNPLNMQPILDSTRRSGRQEDHYRPIQEFRYF